LPDPIWDDLLGRFKVPPEFKAAVKATYVEHFYIDKDYRDLYYSFYTKKHFPYHRYTLRVHFSAADDFKDESAYLGNIVFFLSETSPRVPIPFKYNISTNFLRSKWYRCEATTRIHALGYSYNLKRFPCLSQDAEFTRCAHAAVWSNIAFFAERFNIYRHHSPRDLIGFCEELFAERTFPSDGLNVIGISALIKKAGFYPKIYAAANPRFYEILDTYLESGFPLIAGVSKKGDERSGHAINIIGHEHLDLANFDEATIFPERNKALTYKYRSKYLVCDDNFFPYQQMEISGQGFSYHNLDSLDAIIVPLPRQVNFLAEQVLELANSLLSNVNFPFFALGRALIEPSGSILFRPFLASAGGYQEHIRKNYHSHNPKYFEQVFQMPLPHFVWVVEITTKSALGQLKGYGHFLLDATTSQNTLWDWSIIGWNFGKKMIMLDSQRTFLKESWERSDSDVATQVFPLMRRNLKFD
jgi:hypothetical protein